MVDKVKGEKKRGCINFDTPSLFCWHLESFWVPNAILSFSIHFLFNAEFSHFSFPFKYLFAPLFIPLSFPFGYLPVLYPFNIRFLLTIFPPSIHMAFRLLLLVFKILQQSFLNSNRFLLLFNSIAFGA